MGYMYLLCYVAAVRDPINGQCMVCDLLIIWLRKDENSTIKTTSDWCCVASDILTTAVYINWQRKQRN